MSAKIMITVDACCCSVDHKYVKKILRSMNVIVVHDEEDQNNLFLMYYSKSMIVFIKLKSYEYYFFVRLNYQAYPNFHKYLITMSLYTNFAMQVEPHHFVTLLLNNESILVRVSHHPGVEELFSIIKLDGTKIA